MKSLESEITALYLLAHELLYLGMDDAPIYSDQFTRLNREVFEKANMLFDLRGTDIEEEAFLCVSLLMAYNATLYNNGDKQERIQIILVRSWEVLRQLPTSLLKVRLLAYCYGEVFDKELASEIHEIFKLWERRELTSEESEILEYFKWIESNPYPYCEI